ncbi:MAG TPA: sigma-70 family RNA polymerase sigma factor [Actinospica sp.]|nr:sigma-70 family RNA polymerase sigma factor [Actinospica sp.]
MREDHEDHEDFEAQRPRLRALAYRMLGSLAETDDVVQEAWLRLERAGAEQVRDLPAWLTTVVTRICLNLLRSRGTRREESLDAFTADWLGMADEGRVPEDEALLSEQVGLALLVVLDTLGPAERIAFVLHDLFDVAFDDIAPMMERNAAAVRQLASRARRKVRAVPAPEPGSDPARRRRAVEAYLTAARAGDFEALLKLLDPDVVLNGDGTLTGTGRPVTLQGALTVAKSATLATGRARFGAMALVDGEPALIMAPLGHLVIVMRFAFDAADPGRIRGIDIAADPATLRGLSVQPIG